MARFILFSIVLTSLCSAVNLFAKEEYLLRFKEQDKPLKIVRRKHVDIFTTSWDYKRSQRVHDEKRSYLKHVNAEIDGILEVQLEEINATIKIDGKTLPKLPGPKIRRLAITDQGKAFRDPKNELSRKQLDLSLSLPPKPVSVGATWTTTIGGTENYPQDLEIKFTLSEVKDRKGKKYGVIKGVCKDSSFFPERSCNSRLEISSRSLFDIERGYVIRQRSSSTFITTFTRQRKELPFQIARFAKQSKVIR